MLKQQLKLKLSQKLSPQQIQLMKLVQLPTLEFEQRIKQELEENPALENEKESEEFQDDPFEQEDTSIYDEGNEHIDTEDINIDDYLSDDEIPSYRLESNNYSDSDEDRQLPIAEYTSFHQYLQNQLNTFSLDTEERTIAEFLVGSIDESGYIRRSLTDLTDDLAFTQNLVTTEEKVEEVLHIVQQLEPTGVGARNLQECLLLQLRERNKSSSVTLAYDILYRSFDAFTKKHYDKLMQRHSLTEEQLKGAIEEIEKLNPKPGSGYSEGGRNAEQVIPDFSIRIEDGEPVLILNGRNAPELYISKGYTEMLKGYKESQNKNPSQKEAVLFIKQKLDAAKWFIEAVKQRQQTLFLTMSAIMNYQRDYFLTGDEKMLRPMILKDISDEIGMDVSTISRVVSSKYVDTPYGTKLIKSLFSEGIKNEEGEDVSTLEVRKILEETLEKEDKRNPVTDETLAEILKEKGYPIARRTVAKYREQLGIPVARLRKQI